jgi:hypothetical protein
MVPTVSSTGTNADTSQSVYCATNLLMAEHLRLLLALHEVRAAVVQRDPLQVAIAFAEVIVATRDCREARRIIEASISIRHDTHWQCPHCQEGVPETFDLCWNCGTLQHSTEIGCDVGAQPV